MRDRRRNGLGLVAVEEPCGAQDERGDGVPLRLRERSEGAHAGPGEAVADRAQDVGAGGGLARRRRAELEDAGGEVAGPRPERRRLATRTVGGIAVAAAALAQIDSPSEEHIRGANGSRGGRSEPGSGKEQDEQGVAHGQ